VNVVFHDLKIVCKVLVQSFLQLSTCTDHGICFDVLIYNFQYACDSNIFQLKTSVLVFKSSFSLQKQYITL